MNKNSIYIYIYIYLYIMYDVTSKREMGNENSYKEANPFPYNLPTNPKWFYLLIFFFMKEMRGWKFWEGFPKEKLKNRER